MVKVRLVLFLVVFAPFWVCGQREMPGNSYSVALGAKYPGLLYSYIDSIQTHDYSGNWDLDGDGEKDGVYFVGNGGVHLFFYLRVVVRGRVWDLRWVEVDIVFEGVNDGNGKTIKDKVYNASPNDFWDAMVMAISELIAIGYLK